MPRPPAVAQRKRDRSPGSAPRDARDGFSNTSSCAFEVRSIGLTGAGSSS